MDYGVYYDNSKAQMSEIIAEIYQKHMNTMNTHPN